MNNYIYLHENYDFTNDNVEVKLDLAQDPSSQTNNVNRDGKKFSSNAKNSIPIVTETDLYSPTASPIEGQITSRLPRHTSLSENKIRNENEESFHRPMVPLTPSKSASKPTPSHDKSHSNVILKSITNNEISSNNSPKNRSGDHDIITETINEPTAEDYEDLAIDLMARDVRHFDNYSNISSLSHR